MPYVVSLVPQSPYIPSGLTAIGYTHGTFSKPFKYDEEWISSVLNSGTPMDPEMVPRRHAVDVKAEALPDIFSLGFGYGVTDRVREKVEELEPGVHQFFDIELTTKGGRRPKKRHWLLHICNRLDAIDPEKTTLPLAPGGLEYSVAAYTVGEPIDMVLRKEAIEGKCMWIDRKFMEHFLSDELFDFVEKNGLTKFYSTKVEAV